MSIKKIISMIAAFALALQLFPQVILAESDAAFLSFKQSAEFFDKLEIIDYREEVEANSKVTKGEFVSFVAKLAGYDGSELSVELPYTDVYKGHEYMSEISYAYSFGSFNDDWQVLYPDDNLTMYFAAEVLKNTLGYKGPFASEGYSVQRKLTEGIVPGEYNVLTLAQAYEMLYRATDIEIAEQTTYGASSIQYEVSDVTLLYKYHEITKVSGRVDKTNLVGFDGRTTSDRVISIDGTDYNTDFDDMTEYFGRYADAYVYDIDGKKLVKYITVNYDNKEIKIDAEDFVTFSGEEVTYYDNAKTVTKRVDSPLIVYNGETVSGSEFDKSLFDIGDGSVTLVYSGSNKCDLIVIEEYENMLVSLSDLENETIYSKEVGAEPLNYADAEIINFYAYDGSIVEAAAPESISADSLITYSRSLSGKYMQIYLSSKVINSQLIQMESAADGKIEKVVLSDSSEYKVSDTAAMSGIPQLSLNAHYNIHISFLGNIGAFTLIGDDTNLYGFIAGVSMPKGLADTVEYKLITNISPERTGEMVFSSADTITVDGRKYSAKEAPQIIENNNSQNTKIPVVFKLNSDNEIKSIDTPYYDSSIEPEDSLRERSFGSKFTQRVQVAVPKGYTNLLAQRYYVPLTGLVVITPGGDDSDIRKITRIPSKAVTASSGYLTENIKAYSLGENTAVCPLVVLVDNIADTESTQYEQKIYLVEKISTVIYEEEERTKIVLNNGASAADYYVYDEVPIAAVSSVKPGDIVRASFNSYDEVDGLEIMVHGTNPHYDVGYVYVHNTAKEDGNTQYLMAHQFRVAVGLVKSVEYDASTGKYYVTYMLGDDPEDTGDVEATYVIDSAKSYKVDERTGKIEISTIAASNIKTYESVGNDADVIVVRYEFCVPITQYIISK